MSNKEIDSSEWLSATDEERVKRIGKWRVDDLRGSFIDAMITNEDEASLEFTIKGQGLILCLDTLTPPNYGNFEAGHLEIYIDQQLMTTVYPRASANEIVLSRDLDDNPHDVRVVHRGVGQESGCHIQGFKILSAPSGDLSFFVNGEHNFSLVDVRAVLKKDNKIVRDSLIRNWLTGQCAVVGILPGNNYSLEIIATGWKSVFFESIMINENEETHLPPVNLFRCKDATKGAFKFPQMGHPVIHLSGEQFRMRFKAHDAKVEEVLLVRTVGPAVISKICEFKEDRLRSGVFKGLEEDALYYLTEGVVGIPGDISKGLYDIKITLNYKGVLKEIYSRKCVCIVPAFAVDPVFISYGHMDVWGQGPSEYILKLVELSNIIAPDMVLIANSCNPAYVAGALNELEIPFVINFGNHQSPGKEKWFGESNGAVDFGSKFSVINYGSSWDRDLSEVEKLLNDRSDIDCKVIHGFEYGAPVKEILDKYKISLVHDAHGPGPKVLPLGKTPTIRIGKVNNRSFRIIRFKDGRPSAYTYENHPSKPIPFPRENLAPVRIVFGEPNDGSQNKMTVKIFNDLTEKIPNARIQFVLKKGVFVVDKGRIESQVDSEDDQYSVVTVRLDLSANSVEVVTVD